VMTDSLKIKNQYGLLAFIFAINFLFKLIYISAPSFWYDEIISVQDTLLDFGHIKHEAEWDKNPPFYHYILWVWSKLFGISELGLRSMSVFFNSLTAVLIYVFANKITNRLCAIIATVIFSLHPFLFYYSQEARCFSFLIFLITANLMLLYSLIENPKLYKAFFLGILNFLIFYTHYLAGLILLYQFIYVLIIFRRKWLYIALIYVTPVLLVLIRFTKKQYNVLFFSQEMSKEKNNVPLAQLENLIESLSELFVSYFIAIVFVVFAMTFLIESIKTRKLVTEKMSQFKIFLIFSPVLCILTLYFLGKWTNVFHGRYLIFCIPYIILSFFIFAENKIILWLFTLSMVVFEITGLKFNQSKKMDYRFCAMLTKEIEKKENVNILIQTHDLVNVFTYYYDRNIFESKERMSRDLLATKNIYYIDNINDLKNISFDKKRPILFFQTYQKKEDDIEIMKCFMNENYFKFTTNQIEGVKFSYLKKY
jgi:hypothetical protein